MHDEKPGAPEGIDFINADLRFAGPLCVLGNRIGATYGWIETRPPPTSAMFPAKAFDALVALVARAAARHIVNGEPEAIYEPLGHIAPGLPSTLIHVSGSEVLLHDAQLAAGKLAAAGVPAEMRIWPGQIHDFQLAAPVVPEGTRSLRQIGKYIREATPRIMVFQANFQGPAHNRVTRPLPRLIAEGR